MLLLGLTVWPVRATINEEVHMKQAQRRHQGSLRVGVKEQESWYKIGSGLVKGRIKVATKVFQLI